MTRKRPLPVFAVHPIIGGRSSTGHTGRKV